MASTIFPAPSAERLEHAQSLFGVIPDFPEPGVSFQDITPVLADPAGLRTVAEALLAPFAGQFTQLAGIEARGFLLAGVMAGICAERGHPAGVLTIRKEGKLPAPAAKVEYSLEYGTAAIEAPDVLTSEDRVLIVDDVLATGGTIAACRQLVSDLGAQSVGAGVVMQVDALNGPQTAGEVHTLFHC
ncbi:adenine phosphoribosyltransferase [Nesterenkonia populi]|uniref:adenine phosphoribosyltransferase n=1 Tax=Nesterenkonia populi TaxID=1591087 RepID=UPI0011BEEDE2|nr:adenine phosphoribosyltransferase [Nesterenkonia populi]